MSHLDAYPGARTILEALSDHGCRPSKPDRLPVTFPCPAHVDKKASGSMFLGLDGAPHVKCHAGCSEEAMLGALDRKVSDLRPGAGRGKLGEIVAVYPYHDEDGAVLFEVVRYAPKDFRQRRPDGRGGHTWNMDGVRRVLYHLPTVVKAVKKGWTIYVVEGEKDADALNERFKTTRRRAVATTSPGGAGKWRPEFSATLAGAKRVVIVADKDDAGRRHAAQVRASLEAKIR